MLHLDRVTAVLVDTCCPELAKLALIDSLERVSFKEVIVASPVNLAPALKDARWIQVPYWPNRMGPQYWLWHELPLLLETDFMLILSWDGWIIDETMWTDEFLEYDIVGAPWWFTDGQNVGHAQLRSRRIMGHLRDRPTELPLTHPEDNAICRKYRKELEAFGFKWPTEQLASRFSFETTRPHPDSKHFMFHSPWNFRHVLSPERLEERRRLMRQTPHLMYDERRDDPERDITIIWPHLKGD